LDGAPRAKGSAVSESFDYRGIKIELRGKRWRWRARDGQRIVTQSFQSVDGARAALDIFLNERLHSSLLDPGRGGPTVGALCADWLRHKSLSIAPGTAAQYEIHVRVHITPTLGHYHANLIRPNDLDDFYTTLRWKAAKESHNVLRQAFEWGLQNRLVLRAANPCVIARPSRRSSVDHDGTFESDEVVRCVREKEIPTRTDLEKLLADADERDLETWWLYLKVAATIGARPGEVCALRREHLDVDRGTVRIEWSADKVSGRVKRPKSPWSVRTLALPDDFFRAIECALPTEPNAFLFPSNQRRGQTSPLPCWSARSVTRRLDAALLRTGLPRFTPHALRHYVATHLLDQRWPPLQVARVLGHADDTLVRKLYANHIVDDTQRLIGEAAARLV
jgi:integrase